LNSKFVFLLVFWTFWFALLIIPSVFVGNIFGVILSGFYSVAYAIGVLLLHKRLVKNVKPRYPLAFPGGVDSYFPRFDIPRPIYLDLAEYPEFFEKVDEYEGEEN
jgi:hypothetical protein